MIQLILFCWLYVAIAKEDLIRSYNRVSHQKIDSFDQFSSKFLTDETPQRFTQNVIVGLAEEACWADLERMPVLRAVEHFAGGNSLQSVSLSKSLFPSEIIESSSFSEECIVILSYKKGSLLEEPAAMTSSLNEIDLMAWMVDQTRTTISFTNRFSFPLLIYYHSESSDPLFQMELPPNETIELTSFLGHVFSANLNPNEATLTDLASLSPLNEINDRPEYTSDGFKYIVDYLVVRESHYDFSPHNRLETCEIVTQQTLNELSFALPSSHHDQEELCNNLLLRFIEFSHGIWYEKRLGSNFLQPKLVRPVTSSGFELRKLPQETFDWLSEWYRQEQLKQEQVETSAGPCMNQVVAPSSITHLEPRLKDRLERELRPILEEWYGGDLYLTSIYGIRKYINGSVLRMHVDTVRTHVVSAIMNIDQEVEKDWPLLILDHEDNEHEVIMQKGDMLLYESAKLLHGRPDPFIGSHYDNIFIHFRPEKEEEWSYDWI